MKRFINAIKGLDEMLAHLVKTGDAIKDDGIEVTCYMTKENTVACSIQPIGWHRKNFDSIEEFIEYMEKKKWKKEYK